MFTNRNEAGLRLAKELLPRRTTADLIIGLARGGVMIAAAAAKVLKKPFDVLVVKKIGSPENPEFAIGAVAPEGISYVDTDMVGMTGTDETYMKSRTRELTDEIRQKTALYRGVKQPLSVDARAVVLVDDGAATGATMCAAIRWAQQHKAKKIIVALPVAPPEIAEKLRTLVRDVIVLETPTDFGAVGQFYRNFPQMTDDEVVQLLT